MNNRKTTHFNSNFKEKTQMNSCKTSLVANSETFGNKNKNTYNNYGIHTGDIKF